MNDGGLQPVGEAYIPTSGPTRSRARAIWDEAKRSVLARESAQRTAVVDAATTAVHPISSSASEMGGMVPAATTGTPPRGPSGVSSPSQTNTPWITLPDYTGGIKATHVGWGGRTAQHSTDMDLGRGSARGLHRTYGIRRAVWDLAFGYVSGIPLRSIAYYLLTRSLNRHVARWAMKREGVRFDGWLPVVSAEYMGPPTVGPTGGAGDSGVAA